MPIRHLPSLEALVEDDDARVTAELDLLEASEHVARARRLLERAGARDPETAAALAEQLARLGYHLVATASAIHRRAALAGAPGRTGPRRGRFTKAKREVADSCGKRRASP